MRTMLLLSILFVTVAGAQEKTQFLTGHARQKGKDLYSEKVQITRQNGVITQTRTEFISPEGKRLAVMTSKASKSRFLPDIEFADDRDGYAYTLRHIDDQSLEIRVKDSSSSPWEIRKPFPIKKDMIMIQSVMDFATDHIEEIRGGTKVEASFLVPSKSTDFSMRISLKNPTQDAKAKTIDLLIESGNWLLRNTVFPAFTVTYDFDQHKIRKFVGVSTIMAELGTVEITYE